MLNYLKSEFYRILHGREIYSATAALAGLTVLMNLVLFAFDRLTPDFPYATVTFSLNMMTGSMPMLLMAGLIIVLFLFSDEYKNEKYNFIRYFPQCIFYRKMYCMCSGSFFEYACGPRRLYRQCISAFECRRQYASQTAADRYSRESAGCICFGYSGIGSMLPV